MNSICRTEIGVENQTKTWVWKNYQNLIAGWVKWKLVRRWLSQQWNRFYVGSVCDKIVFALTQLAHVKNFFPTDLKGFDLGQKNPKYLMLCAFNVTVGTNVPQSTYIYRVQSNVWRLPNYWPPTPSPPSKCVLPPAPKAGGYTLAGRWGGGG